jgi:hypothetical protein
MYTRPYAIETPFELETITRLADFYCALPLVSATLTGALVGGRTVKREQDDSKYNLLSLFASDLLLIAKRLRHNVLCRECFIHVVGTMSTYNDDPYTSITYPALQSDKELWPLLITGHAKLSQLLLGAHRAYVAATQQRVLRSSRSAEIARRSVQRRSSIL